MLKKAIITGVILLSFLVASINIVVAKSTTLTDDTGDVVKEGETVTGKNNIDIKQLVASRDYRKVTLRLTVEGNIEDKGNIIFWRFTDEDFIEEYYSGMTEEEITNILLDLLSEDIIQYSFELYTSDNIYTIIYINKEIVILDGELNTLDGSTTVNGGTLTITFNLPSSQENMTEVAAAAEESQNSGETFYEDSEGVFGVVDDPLGSSGSSGDDDDDDNGSPGFELITILVAIVIGVILLRKKRT